MQRLVDDAFPLFVVADFGVTSQREVLSEGMALEAVVCENATEVGVASEEHAKHVPGLPFIPVCPPEDRNATWDRVGFASICLDAYPCGMLDSQQVVDDFEAFLAFWKVDGGDVDDTLELALGMISKESQDWDDGRGGDVQGELILQYGELLYEFWETLHEI